MKLPDPVLAEMPWGGRLWLFPEDLIGRTMLGPRGAEDWRVGRVPARADGNFWDGELLLPLFEEAVVRGGTVVDLGANVGQAGGWLEPRGITTISVEAHLPVAALLKKNVQGPVWWWAAAEEFGKYALRGDLDFTNIGGSSFALRYDGYGTPGGPVDSLLSGEEIVLIKSDCQGMDLKALRGLQRAIERCRPIICFEYEAGLAEESWEEHLAWMTSQRGYSWLESETHPGNWVGRAR